MQIIEKSSPKREKFDGEYKNEIQSALIPMKKVTKNKIRKEKLTKKLFDPSRVCQLCICRL